MSMKICHSHSVLASPFSGGSLILRAIGLVDVSDLRYERIVRVGVSQQGADWEQNLGDGQGRWPLVLQDIKANATIWVNVGMVDPGSEVALGWLEGVVSWEVDVQEEHTSSIRRIIRAHDGCLPVILVFLVNWSSWAVSGWVLAKIDKFLLDSLECHFK